LQLISAHGVSSWREAETGLVYRAGDVEQLVGALSFLWERPELAARTGEAGYQLVQQKHSPDDHHQSIYRRIVSSSEPVERTSSSPLVVPLRKNRKGRAAFIGARGVIGKYSGIEGYYEEVGSRLAQTGHDVTIHCRSYFTPRQDHNSSHNFPARIGHPALSITIMIVDIGFKVSR